MSDIDETFTVTVDGKVLAAAVRDANEAETLDGGELVYRMNEDPDHTSVRAAEDGGHILEGRMMPYDEWTEVRSSIEGHFLERFTPGSLAKTMAERAKRIRVMFEHGMDFLGRQSIAAGLTFDDREDGAWYDAALFRSVPELIVEGLRHNVYGSSIRFRPVKWDRVRSPAKSEHNPEGIPEHTIREAMVQEFSVVSFPQYEGATAAVRSLTDEIAARQLLTNPDRLLEIIARSTTTTEPQHSGHEETTVSAVEPQHSATKDYLNPKEEKPSWLF
jgi:HK97 family phage prohead protease